MPISFIGSARDAAGPITLALPAHAAGDLLVMFAFRDGNTTPPPVPAGWEIIGTATNTGVSATLCYRVAVASGTLSGNWDTVSGLVCQVYRGAVAIGATVGSSDGTTSVNYAGLTFLSETPSWVVAFAGHRSTNTTLETPPTGTTFRAGVASGICEIAGFDTNGAVASFAGDAIAVGGTQSGWATFTLELAEAPLPADPNGIIAFTLPGSGTWVVPAGVTVLPEVLVVAGGGSGGSDSGGGGGAGGVLYLTNVSVTPGASISYTVGSGGVASASGGAAGVSGGDSVFGANTAIGGGGGGGFATNITGKVGGSGGGGGSANTAASNPIAAGAGTSGQGNTGGTGEGALSTKNLRFGGGGGGSNAAGQPGGAANAGNAGDGGAGSFFATFEEYGESGYFGGGGGGGTYAVVSNSALRGLGGIGGGGDGADTVNTAGFSGLDNTGGGGGGGSGDLTPITPGGNGGSGVILILLTPPEPTPQNLEVTTTVGTPVALELYPVTATGLNTSVTLGMPQLGELASFIANSLEVRSTLGISTAFMTFPLTATGIQSGPTVGTPLSGRNYVLAPTSLEVETYLGFVSSVIITDIVQFFPRTVRVPAENRTIRIRGITR